MDGGRVYSSFDRNIHLREIRIDPRRPLLWALDFNVDPMASVIAQEEAGGKIRIIGEIFLRHSTTQAACDEFWKRYPAHLAGVTIYGDASGYHQQTTGASDYSIIKDFFRSHGISKVDYAVPTSNPSVRERINLVNMKLRSASGTISLAIDPSCKELVRDFEEVSFKEASSQIDKDRDRMRTHLSDALGYLLLEAFKPPVGEQGRPLPIG
jgi:hypothetical protein